MTKQGPRAILAVVLVGFCACSTASGDERAPKSGGNAAEIRIGAGLSDARQFDATQQFSRFLDASVATVRQGPELFKDLQACLPDEMPDRVLWLADSRVISLAVHGDSALARAEFTTVAEQVGSTSSYHGWTATQRVRTDTGTWKLVRVRDGGTTPRWMVCGASVEGDDFARLGREITWQPAGASERSAHALIDSIRSARRRPDRR